MVPLESDATSGGKCGGRGVQPHSPKFFNAVSCILQPRVYAFSCAAHSVPNFEIFGSIPPPQQNFRSAPDVREDDLRITFGFSLSLAFTERITFRSVFQET